MSAPTAQAKLLRMLLLGGWAIGDRLPAERRLATEIGCNYHTLRKAVGQLVELGVLERRVGSGCYLKTLPRPESAPAPETGIALGVLLTVETGRFFDILLARLHHEAAARGARLLIQPVAAIGPDCVEAVYQLEKQGVRALVVPRAHDPQALAALAQLSPLPLVIAEHVPGLEDAYFERPELAGAGDRVLIARLCEHLMARWQRLVYVAPEAMDSPSQRWRLAAFVQEANRRELPTEVLLLDPAVDLAARLARLADQRGRLGVIGFDDGCALAAMAAARRLGWQPGSDLGVIGINNEPAAALADPPLSSVDFDYAHLGEYLVRHALARAAGGSDQGQGLPEHRIVLRASCGLRSPEGIA